MYLSFWCPIFLKCFCHSHVQHAPYCSFPLPLLPTLPKTTWRLWYILVQVHICMYIVDYKNYHTPPLPQTSEPLYMRSSTGAQSLLKVFVEKSPLKRETLFAGRLVQVVSHSFRCGFLATPTRQCGSNRRPIFGTEST